MAGVVCAGMSLARPHPISALQSRYFLSSYFLHRNRIVERLHLNIFLFTYCLINSFFNYVYSQYGFGELIRNRMPFTYYRLRVIDE